MTTTTQSKLRAALVNFQSEVRDVAPNAEANTGTFSYKYADLSTVLDAIRPALAANQLAIVQTPVSEDGRVGVRTILVHLGGEELDLGDFMLPMTQNTPQGAGACITYARRYAIAALAGICTDHDSDAAEHQPERRQEERPREQPPSSGVIPQISEKQAKRAVAIARTSGEKMEPQVHGFEVIADVLKIGKLPPQPEGVKYPGLLEHLQAVLPHSRYEGFVKAVEDYKGPGILHGSEEEPPPPDETWEQEEF